MGFSCSTNLSNINCHLNQIRLKPGSSGSRHVRRQLWKLHDHIWKDILHHWRHHCVNRCRTSLDWSSWKHEGSFLCSISVFRSGGFETSVPLLKRCLCFCRCWYFCWKVKNRFWRLRHDRQQQHVGVQVTLPASLVRATWHLPRFALLSDWQYGQPVSYFCPVTNPFLYLLQGWFFLCAVCWSLRSRPAFLGQRLVITFWIGARWIHLTWFLTRHVGFYSLWAWGVAYLLCDWFKGDLSFLPHALGLSEDSRNTSILYLSLHIYVVVIR